jgi:hypothetical protein
MRTLEVKNASNWKVLTRVKTKQELMDRLKDVQTGASKAAEFRSCTLVGPDQNLTAVKYFPSIALQDKIAEDRKTRIEASNTAPKSPLTITFQRNRND